MMPPLRPVAGFENVPLMLFYQICLNGSARLNKMTTTAKNRQETNSAGFSFPAHASHGLLSMLVLHKFPT